MIHQADSTAYAAVLEALIENGFEGMAAAMEVLLNEAMKLERSQFLGAGGRRSKAKLLDIRLGRLQANLPEQPPQNQSRLLNAALENLLNYFDLLGLSGADAPPAS